ncbi:MAG: zinc-ribbon domain-containing protein [Promethearchaeota archaeon]
MIEDIYFYIDLASEKGVKKKDLVRAVQKFFKSRAKIGLLGGQYGVFFFKEGGVPFLSANKTDAAGVVKVISEDWNARAHESYLENGLFYCLSDVANHFQSDAGRQLRIIIISDTPSGASSSDSEAQEEKTKALLDLVEKFKFFPTFIDIIRVGKEKFYPDDVKLRLITMTTNGGLFYAEDAKTLEKVLNGLAINKNTAPLDPTGAGTYIGPEHKPFYEKLASELLPTDAGGTCCVCQQESSPYSEGLEDRKDDASVCFNCNVLYHDLCAARYSFEHNIGLYHIFRCKRCGALLKVKESLVQRVNGLPPTEELEARIPRADVPREIMQEPEQGPTQEPEQGPTQEPAPRRAEQTGAGKTVVKTAKSLFHSGQAVGLSAARSFFLQRPKKKIHEPAEKPQSEKRRPDRPSGAKSTPEAGRGAGERRVWKPPPEIKDKQKRTVKPSSRCTQCGKPLKPADKFCPFCGAPV